LCDRMRGSACTVEDAGGFGGGIGEPVEHRELRGVRCRDRETVDRNVEGEPVAVLAAGRGEGDQRVIDRPWVVVGSQGQYRLLVAALTASPLPVTSST
jgi:hypothetical protein